MTRQLLYMLDDGRLVTTQPSDPNVSYVVWVNICARPGYVLHNIFTTETRDSLTLPLGCDAFWKEVKLDKTK